MVKEKLVPNLRFKEFTDEWGEVQLKEICKVQDGTHSTPNYVDDGIPFYSVETITSNVSPKFITKEEHETLIKRCNPQFGDILLTRIGTLAESKIVDWNYEFSIYVSLALLSSIKINNEFLNQYLKTEFYKKEFLKRSLLLAVPQKINLKDLNETKIRYPQNNEAKKIANFLNKIDRKIELLEHKHYHYQEFKKYLMQQIFAQKLRFDFNDEWKIMRLNELTFYQEGPGVRNYQYTKTGVKLLNVGNFVNNNLELNNTDRYISEDEAYGKYEHFLVDEGDLLIACSGIKAEYFNEKIAFAEKKHLPLCMNTSTMRFKSLDPNLLNLNYLKCYFQSELFKKQIFRILTGSAQFNFGPTHLKYLKIPIPSLAEQNKIFNLFESVDNKILSINVELQQMNNFKKGLLQQMLGLLYIHIKKLKKINSWCYYNV